jgi:hypothetical protein
MHASAQTLHGNVLAQPSSLSVTFCSVHLLAQAPRMPLCNCCQHSSCTVVYAGLACFKLTPLPWPCLPQVRYTEDEWLEKLGRQSFHILREEGTEFPNSRWAGWTGVCKWESALLTCSTGAGMQGCKRLCCSCFCADAEASRCIVAAPSECWPCVQLHTAAQLQHMHPAGTSAAR